MLRLDDLALFVRSAALGSFSNAARESDLLPGQVSAAIGRLERELGLRLFARSTRSLRLTAEGEQYLPYAREALAALREGEERLHPQSAALEGVLQIAAPSDFGRNLLLPWLGEFRRLHPRLKLRFFLSDQRADIFRAPVDVAIRFGAMEDASFVAMPLAPANRRVLVAAPSYLAQHGRPATPEALVQHACLVYLLHGRAYDKWLIEHEGERRLVSVNGALLCDDAEVVRRWAVAGEGIAYKSWLDVSDDVRAGRLVLLFEPDVGEALPLHLICPHRRQYSPAIQQLHAFLKTRCQALTAELVGRMTPLLPE